MSFRLVSWNMRRAGPLSKAWVYLSELGPDIALLQEVTAIPVDIAARFSAIARLTSGPDGQQQHFSTVVLVGQGACAPDMLRSNAGWVDDELARFAGNLVATRVRLGGAELRVVSVHSPAWPIGRARLAGIDTSAVKLTQNPDVWLADVLWAALPPSAADAWIVGGDFNLSETFDAWPGGPREIGSISTG